MNIAICIFKHYAKLVNVGTSQQISSEQYVCFEHFVTQSTHMKSSSQSQKKIIYSTSVHRLRKKLRIRSSLLFIGLFKIPQSNVTSSSRRRMEINTLAKTNKKRLSKLNPIIQFKTVLRKKSI